MITRIMTLCALISFCAISCTAKKITGNGNIVTKQLSVSEYSAISLSSGGMGGSTSWFGLFNTGQRTSYVFNYEQGESASLQVTIDENLYPYLKAQTQDGELTITTKDGAELVPTTFKLNGTSKSLKKIHMSGNTDFVLQSPLKGDNLEVLTTSGSDITMKQPVQMNLCTITAQSGGDVVFDNLTCKTIECKASSGSDITLKGKAESGQYSASSGSDIQSNNFIVARLVCSASSGSDISTHVTEYLEASASGGGDIQYKGNPKTKNSTSGGGDITGEGH